MEEIDFTEEKRIHNMTKKQLAKEVIERLKKEYPDAGCTLDYDQAWKLLVSVRLAAQCTDARVNVVVEDLYKKFPDVNALADADVSEIEEIVRPCGLGKSKARDISACMKMIRDEYHGKVPLYHFDMYRVSSWEDLYSTGFFDYLDAGGVLAIEWSENIEAALPADVLRVTFEPGEGKEERILTFEGIDSL